MDTCVSRTGFSIRYEGSLEEEGLKELTSILEVVMHLMYPGASEKEAGGVNLLLHRMLPPRCFSFPMPRRHCLTFEGELPEGSRNDFNAFLRVLAVFLDTSNLPNDLVELARTFRDQVPSMDKPQNRVTAGGPDDSSESAHPPVNPQDQPMW